MDGLMDAASVGNEPKIDGTEGSQDAPANPGFLLDLPNRGLFGSLTGLEVTFGERPHQAPTSVKSPNQRGALRVRSPIDDESAGTRFLIG